MTTDVFQFMALRAGEKLDVSKTRKKFIKDDVYLYFKNTDNPMFLNSANSGTESKKSSGAYDVDLFSSNSNSPIGKFIYSALLQAKSEATIISDIEEMLMSEFVYSIDGYEYKTGPLIKNINLNNQLNEADGMLLGQLSGKKYYGINNSINILPCDVSEIPTPYTNEVEAILKLSDGLFKVFADNTIVNGLDTMEKTKLLFNTLGLVQPNLTLTNKVFNLNLGEYTMEFALTKRILFDTLYGLYILRKKENISLEPAIRGLCGCHIMETLAITEYFNHTLINKNFPSNTENFISVLSGLYPALATWDPTTQYDPDKLLQTGVVLISNIDDIKDIMQVTPIINPIIARLNRAFRPFNTISPIGIGDLKVVKQKFKGYKKGEISHIETVLSGETKTRIYRNLDKTEDSFSTSSSSNVENTKDNQSTSRFELKNEAEDTIKTDLNLNANATFTYKGNPVIDASITAGMTYSNSRSESNKSSQNFVNEVISKATTKVQNSTSQQRSQTHISEIEETNTHAFTNSPTNDNISGVYQWLDKVYEGSIHNYGKRLMFEFILPEPAQFYVESKLYAYAASLDLPPYPQKSDVGSTDTTAPLPVVSASEITEDLYYNNLSKHYSLGDLLPPPASIENIPVKINPNGGTNFTKSRAYNDTTLLIQDYNCSIDNLPAGYDFSSLKVNGTMLFRAKFETDSRWQNTLQILLNSSVVLDKVDETLVNWTLDDLSITQMPGLLGNSFVIGVGTKTCDSYTLRLFFNFQRNPATFSNWQNAVFERLKTTKPIPTNADTSAADQDYQSQLMDYQKKLDDLKAVALNDIIQGKSSLWNQDTVNVELKRQCISMIAKEFDSIRTDDIVSNIRDTSKISLDVFFPTLKVNAGSLSPKKDTSAQFSDNKDNPLQTFTFPNIDASRLKGRYVQFLEQAFEWNELSSIFYPYFWASPPKWIELMNREDPSDPLFSKFLQAGSSKVLLAVKPGYENGVLHFLATREPWEGGPAPVIGDPLYIPLYEEIKSQQDDLSNSVPVGDPWIFTLPTSLIYLENGKPLPNEYTEPANT